MGTASWRKWQLSCALSKKSQSARELVVDSECGGEEGPAGPPENGLGRDARPGAHASADALDGAGRLRSGQESLGTRGHLRVRAPRGQRQSGDHRGLGLGWAVGRWPWRDWDLKGAWEKAPRSFPSWQGGGCHWALSLVLWLCDLRQPADDLCLASPLRSPALGVGPRPCVLGRALLWGRPAARSSS